ETKYHARSLNTSPRSAANTPSWHVNDEITRIVVNVSAYGMLRWVGSGGQSPCAWARATKYIAKSPAKNINSCPSHTTVPTATMFGRFSEWTRWLMEDPEVPTVLVTGRSMTRRSNFRPIGAINREIDFRVSVVDLRVCKTGEVSTGPGDVSRERYVRQVRFRRRRAQMVAPPTGWK